MEAPRGTPDAVLRPGEAEQALDLRRVPAGEEVAAFVDYHWYVGWRRGDDPHEQQVVPQPRVHLAVEDERLLVHGINREPFVRTLRGTGHTLGAAFHPGGFRPLLGRGVGSLVDRVVPAGDVLGADDRPAAARILAAQPGDLEVMVAAMEGYLRPLLPAPDPVVDEVRALVSYAEHQHGLARAEDLAVHASRSLRSLQRLFTDYVGVGPKWVIARFRILDAAAAAHGGEPVDWAGLAADLGFTDQAHLTRAFTAVVGTPPATYRRQV